MKKQLQPHSSNVGPTINIDLEEVAAIKQYGNNRSSAEWVEAEFVFKSGLSIKIKMTPESFQETQEDWQGQQEVVEAEVVAPR